MNASIIVPVYNQKNLIEKCLNSLLGQTMNGYEIIVIDDGSTDGTKDILKVFSSNEQIKVFYNDHNLGPSYARNRGIQECKGEFIALIDSDCVAQTEWLAEIIRPFHQNPSIMITAGKVSGEKPSTYWQLVNKGENFIRTGPGFVQEAWSCNMALRRDFALRHPFDERIKSRAICEDLDLCFFCVEEKNKIFYTNLAQVIHCHRATLQSTLKQQFNWGCYNTYIRIKHHQFPYLNYGTWTLLAAFFLFIPGKFNHQDILVHVSLLLMAIYLGLVLYLDIRTKEKNPYEIFISYPGSLLKCLSNCWGNVFWIWQHFSTNIELFGIQKHSLRE